MLPGLDNACSVAIRSAAAACTICCDWMLLLFIAKADSAEVDAPANVVLLMLLLFWLKAELVVLVMELLELELELLVVELLLELELPMLVESC